MDLKLFMETFGKAGQKVFIIFNYVVLILIIQHFVLIVIIKHLCDLFPGKQVDCYFKGIRLLGWSTSPILLKTHRLKPNYFKKQRSSSSFLFTWSKIQIQNAQGILGRLFLHFKCTLVFTCFYLPVFASFDHKIVL